MFIQDRNSKKNKLYTTNLFYNIAFLTACYNHNFQQYFTPYYINMLSVS